MDNWAPRQIKCLPLGSQKMRSFQQLAGSSKWNHHHSDKCGKLWKNTALHFPIPSSTEKETIKLVVTCQSPRGSYDDDHSRCRATLKVFSSADEAGTISGMVKYSYVPQEKTKGDKVSMPLNERWRWDYDYPPFSAVRGQATNKYPASSGAGGGGSINNSPNSSSTNTVSSDTPTPTPCHQRLSLLHSWESQRSQKYQASLTTPLSTTRNVFHLENGWAWTK